MHHLKSAFQIILIIAALLFLQRCGQDHLSSVPDHIDFNFDVKPILVQKCYLCHGPDSGSRKGGVRLDTYAGATAALKEGGKAIVPGHLDSSILIERIHHTDPEMVMPPQESKLKLTEKEIAILTKWIKQGAEWKPHWAFIPPQIPDMKGRPRRQNEVDYFIGKKITESGLKPAPQANKNTLIRRVAYMLTGMPPSIEAIQKYLADNSSDAYERMVDQYLHSNRFGEKWARHWMDVVRYAETKGHEFDYQIAGAWRYRDYLIRAFNQDIPYDQFVKEQLAGDLQTTSRKDSLSGNDESQIGTVFYTMYEGTHSPVDVRKDESDRIDNMIDVTTKTFQGLTVACARCHDHKFDPIATKDYYSLYGVMESSRFSPVPVSNTQQKALNILKVNELKTYLKKQIADQWIKESNTSERQPVSLEKTLKPVSSGSSSNYTLLGDFRGQDIGDWKSDGFAFGKKTTLGEPLFDTAHQFIGLDEGKASSRILGTGIFGALRSPNFLIEKDFIGIRAKGIKSSMRIIVDNFQLISFPIFGGLDQKVDTTIWKNYTFDVALWKGHKAYVEILPGKFTTHVYQLPKDAYIEVQYATTFNGKWVTPPLQNNQSTLFAKTTIDHWKMGTVSYEEINFLQKLVNNKVLGIKISQAKEIVVQSEQLLSDLVDTAFYNGIYDGFGINSPVFRRGNHHDLTEQVPRKFISVITNKEIPFPSNGSGRMELAESIIDPKNPLTARVMVNRIWHHLFGKGLVETTDNFGLQGKLPSHPELLDFLAIKFQQDGWSTKKMIRYIMLSNTFKQAVEGDPKSYDLDPDDVWISHYPMRRLEAEEIRDALLTVSGSLDTLMYGQPVPAYITSFMQGRGRPNNSGPLDGNRRRSIYQEVRRNFLEPMMITFDRPIPFSTFGKRNVTNVPAQSLIMMNDPFVIKQAEEMACLVTSSATTLDQKIETIYYRAFARMPSKKEKAEAHTFLQSLATHYKVDEKEVGHDINVWRDYCHIIFNAKEFIYLT